MASRIVFPMSSLPHTQALSSQTFKPPPLDGSLLLPELFEWNSINNPSHPLFVYCKGDGDVRKIFWPEAVSATHVGASIIRDRLNWSMGTAYNTVVAILAHSDSIPYFIVEMSIMRAGYVVFPISPRNSAAAVAHLVERANIRHILVGREMAMSDLANEAFSLLRSRGYSSQLPDVSHMLSFEELFLPSSAHQESKLEDEEFGSQSPAMILHSSGSTAFPKPVPFNAHRLVQMCCIPYFGERDLTGKVFSMHVMPMFHGMGVSLMCWAASCGLVLSAFEPKVPTPVPNPDTHFMDAKATESDIIFAVPAIIEAWSRNPDRVQWLAQRDGVLYGGGPLNKQVGDLLTSQGVSIYILYGSTEGAVLSPIIPAKVGYDWDYFKFPRFLHTKMQLYSDNTYELVIVASDLCRPCVINTQVNGIDAYATSDLFMEHPEKPGYWRIYGRSDDQIIHSSGEKTNPGPLESMLNQDPNVLSCVMFGRGHFQAGVLIDPKPGSRFDPVDLIELADFRNQIWPTIEKMNAYAPQHSRIFKEMILVASPAKPFTYTAKGTVRRQAVINDYAQEIEELYKIVDESTQSSIPAPQHWDIVSTVDFVRSVVAKVLVRTVQDTDDLFQHGCDSLQATWIRNSIMRALRDSAQLDTRKTAQNFVYEHPTVANLAAYVSRLASGAESDEKASPQDHIDAMKAMVQAYGSAFPPFKPLSTAPAADLSNRVVILTGTTGSLGCHVLSRLVSSSSVSKIYALNRPSRDGQGIRERQIAALTKRGLSSDVLGDKVVLLETDLTLPKLGLPERLYNEMRSHVTHIIHNAWRVNFNLSLTSFESNVKGLRSLVDFALSSELQTPPRLTFMSTIGVTHNTRTSETQNEVHIEPQLAVSNGYSESKWVAEEILHLSLENTPLRPLIVRVGQICGAPDGSWSTSEWFPALVHSAQKLKVFPRDGKPVDWIQLDLAAAAVAELSVNDPSKTYFHLVHPRPVTWDLIAEVIARELSVDLVPYSEWLSRLEIGGASITNQPGQADVETLRSLPALRILPFFRAIQSSAGPNALGFPALSVTNAVTASPTLGDPKLRQISRAEVKMWISYWREVGFLSDK